MSKIRDINQLPGPGQESTGGISKGVQDTIAGVNQAIDNAKSLLAQVKSLQESQRQQSGPGEPQRGMDLGQLAELLIKKGYGDTPLGKLLQQAGPFTLNQLRRLAGDGADRPDG